MKLSIYSNDALTVAKYRRHPKLFFLPAEIANFRLAESGLTIPGTGALVLDLNIKAIKNSQGETVETSRMDAQALFFHLRNPNYLSEYDILDAELRG